MIQDIGTLCTGCKACGDICSKSAISYRINEEGFWYPVVDESKCVGCGECRRICPSINAPIPFGNKTEGVFSAWSRDDDTRISSTSGGVFWEMAEFVVDNGGAVVGSQYTNNWKGAKHVVATSVEEIKLLRGSKYFQSDTEGIYKCVKKELLYGKQVLFCGTPCQNMALRSYLSKEYDNLLCVDFICRSINSPKAFSSYIEELEQLYDSKAKFVQLKNKKTGWQSLATYVEFENGQYSHKDRNEDWWLKGFLGNDLYTRDSCFLCKYRVLPRITSDITIGDFWGIKNQSSENMFKGISTIIVNSPKGHAFLDKIKDRLVMQEHSIEDVLPQNPALLSSPKLNNKKREFFKLLRNHSFSVSVEKSIIRHSSKALKIKRKIRSMIRFALNSDISLFMFMKYNFFSKNIHREQGVFIIPYKHAILDFHPSSSLNLKGRHLVVGCNRLKKSKTETFIRLEKGAVWNCDNGAEVYYGSTIELKENAQLRNGFFSMNTGSVVIADKMIDIGEDAMFGRNCIIYDSDFHMLLDKDGIASNKPENVKIGDHVWLTTNVVVSKGVSIGAGCVVSANTVVTRSFDQGGMISGRSIGTVIDKDIKWDRSRCPR